MVHDSTVRILPPTRTSNFVKPDISTELHPGAARSAQALAHRPGAWAGAPQGCPQRAAVVEGKRWPSMRGGEVVKREPGPRAAAEGALHAHLTLAETLEGQAAGVALGNRLVAAWCLGWELPLTGYLL